jgi:hypothetical protein
LSGKSFIEFRFDEVDKHLFDISIVGIDLSELKDGSDILLPKLHTDEYFLCKILEQQRDSESTVKAELVRGLNTVCIMFDSPKISDLIYYQIGKNVFLGVNQNMCLASILLNDLSEKNIFDFFGF